MGRRTHDRYRTGDQFANLDLFAAQIAAMDQVITIDNSTAHLAGALGVPVWLLLPFAADWRWLQGRADSPWVSYDAAHSADEDWRVGVCH